MSCNNIFRKHKLCNTEYFIQDKFNVIFFLKRTTTASVGAYIIILDVIIIIKKKMYLFIIIIIQITIAYARYRENIYMR